jgi:hypothetical protein
MERHLHRSVRSRFVLRALGGHSEKFITCINHQLPENCQGGGKCRDKLFAYTRLLAALTVSSESVMVPVY